MTCGPVMTRALAIECGGTVSPNFFANVDLPQRGCVAAVLRFALGIDLPDTAEELEVVDVDAGQYRLQRAEHIIHPEPQRLRLLVIDVQINGRVVGAIGREDAGQSRVL